MRLQSHTCNSRPEKATNEESEEEQKEELDEKDRREEEEKEKNKGPLRKFAYKSSVHMEQGWNGAQKAQPRGRADLGRGARPGRLKLLNSTAAGRAHN
ncbi:unnamed protein product [Nippostrongylus brasiliensis]|uniref:Uncharacterized protein n=1 Tax=Nippostrongylus brasiliensis TaxID=27835 RepID=A0A0N4XV91_NIPBR|nr:unnamed protein product [Nippostrongylus brasiliensis]